MNKTARPKPFAFLFASCHGSDKKRERTWLANVWALTLFTLMSILAPAQSLTTLDSFTGGANGAFPSGTLIQGTDGYLYGTSEGGPGENEGGGTVFRLSSTGALTTLYAFCKTSGCPDGTVAASGLVEGPDGNFYGTTSSGGANGAGTIYKITPKGVLTTLYNFCSQVPCIDGGYPDYGSLLWSDGAFYGTTQRGGTSGSGTVFKITSSGTFTSLHSFCSEQNCTDGATPSVGLIQGTDGFFYGETDLGGANQQGILYRMSRGGKFETLYAFCSLSSCADGSEPIAGLVQSSDGNFYGTTSGLGGQSTPYGTVFRITPSGTLTTLHVFDHTDGSWAGAMIQATDGNLYGTTWNGGAFGGGTLFEITLDGTFTTIYNFCSQTSCTDGQTPISGLLQETDGEFYGTTDVGGANAVCNGFRCGTIFSLSAGLGPFVKAQPTSGKVNSKVSILGNDLSGKISVTFNGVPVATIQIVSNSVIRTRVPAGATTGTIQVKTRRGTFSTNVPFEVSP